jgi:hypothetical protein
LRDLPARETGTIRAELEAAAAVSVRASELDVPMYATDPLVRRAQSLQQTLNAVQDWRKTA